MKFGKIKKIIATMITLVMLFAMVAACAPQAADPPAADAGNNEQATRDSIVINLPADISNLDPIQTVNNPDFTMFANIFDRLVEEGPDGMQPHLAERWEVSDDGMTYTFFLRQGVLFHNGDELTADDVVFTYERAMESPFTAGPLVAVESVVAVDDHTVEFNLAFPFSPFIFSHSRIYVVNERAVTELGDGFSTAPVGTGPFMFESHQPGQQVTLTRFDDYFLGPAAIREVVWRVILNPATVSIALEAGDIDIALNLPPGDISRLEDHADFVVTPWESKSLNFLTLNATTPPLDNHDVRRAVAHAIDRQAIVDMSQDGFGTPTNNIFNHFTFGYSPDVTGYDFDLDRARELLASAGFADGFDVTFKTIGGVFENQAMIIQDSLAQIGINASIDMMDQEAFLGDVLTLNYEMANLAMALGLDADDWAMVFTADGGMHFTGLVDPQIEALFEEGRVTTDSDARVQIYRQIAQMVNDQAAFIPLFFTSTAYVHVGDVSFGWIDSNGVFKVWELEVN